VLRDLGCDLGQGWNYGKGEPAVKVTEVLMARGSLSARKEPLDVSLFQQQHQLDALYRQAPVGLAYLDMNYRIIRANEHFAARHGRPLSEITGKTIHDLMAEQMPVFENVEQALCEAVGLDLPVVRPVHNHRRSGLAFYTRVKDVAGESIGFSVVIIDLADEMKLKNALTQVQAENEAQLKRERDYAEAILNSLPGIFYQYGPDLRLKRWNRNHEVVTGYSSDELLGTDPSRFFVEDERQKYSMQSDGSSKQDMVRLRHTSCLRTDNVFPIYSPVCGSNMMASRVLSVLERISPHSGRQESNNRYLRLRLTRFKALLPY